jgi:MoaA/NifB/PqqE/SkfB family radical SAM enzyme
MNMDTSRALHLRRIGDQASQDPTNLLRTEGLTSPPDLQRDYREIVLKDLLDEDLRIAQLTIEPSYYCNLSCQFCALPVDSKTQLDWDKVRSIVKLLRLGGLRWAVIAGGEPGIAPRILEILGDLSAIGIRATMLTHGMWAANRAFLEKVVDAGLSEINMSIKSVDNPRFKALCGSGSIDRQMQGLSNLSAMVGRNRFDRLLVNYVVTHNGPEELPRLFDLLRDKRIKKLILTFMEPYTPAAAALSPTTETLRQLREMVDGLARSVDFQVDFEGFPLCHMQTACSTAAARPSGALSSRRDEIRLQQRIPKISISPKADADYLSVHYGYQRYLQYVKLPACSGCMRADVCPGIHQLLREKITPYPITSL